jgi:hypothetical protein
MSRLAKRISMEQDLEAQVRNSNFVVREDGEKGLFAVDDAGNETRISNAIWHLGNAVRADGSGGASDVIRFVDRNGAPQEVIIPHKDSFEAWKMFETLLDRNFAVFTSKGGRYQLKSYLEECRQSPNKTYLLADRMGGTTRPS